MQVRKAILHIPNFKVVGLANLVGGAAKDLEEGTRPGLWGAELVLWGKERQRNLCSTGPIMFFLESALRELL